MSKKEKGNNGTGIMMGAIILMVVIVFVVFIVFFVNTAKNGSRIAQVYSNSLESANSLNDTNSLNEVNSVSTNEVEYIQINNTIEGSSSVDLPKNPEDEKYKYDKSYIGKYTWKQGDNSISFEISDDNGQLRYQLSYYPNGVGHASEELMGKWSTSSNIVSADNENPDAIATYSFSDIKYNKKNIEIYIQANTVLNGQLSMYKIPDGKYTFKRVD